MIPRHRPHRSLALGPFATRGLSLALALAFWLGCANPPLRQRAVLLGAENRVLLILPLNLTAAMPPELAFFGPIVWEEIEGYLRAQERQLKTVARATAREIWLECIRQARAGEKGASAGFDDAARLLAVELRKHSEFDAMIVPSLFVVDAPFAYRIANWDGVEREIDVEARGLEARSLAATPLEGAAPAASLHVAVFDAQGEKIHEGRGGLELLARIRVTGSSEGGPPTVEFETRSDVFDDREDLREGIAAAFEPLLPALAK